jgi:DNA-binding transcriptional ArsR family regulator
VSLDENLWLDYHLTNLEKPSMEIQPSPHMTWISGTAFDLFISLFVLHHPDRFGLRASWAAGVRSRLPQPERDFLERTQEFPSTPLLWLCSLGEDRSASAALKALAALPVGERLSAITRSAEASAEYQAVIQKIQANGKYSDEDLQIVSRELSLRSISLRPQAALELCKAWSQVERFGEDYFQALSTYYQVFFAEEERRILPVLASGLAEARSLAVDLPLPELFEQLTHGVQSESWYTADEIVLVPSFWSTPLIFHARLTPTKVLVVFGSRPKAQTLVPGGSLPETLVDALKALADPTRLRILRHLSSQPLTPTELAHRLRLRPPTVIHHLNALRLAGLVAVTVQADSERRYTLRHEVLQEHLQELQTFIDNPRN